jgi:hypothetical protein
MIEEHKWSLVGQVFSSHYSTLPDSQLSLSVARSLRGQPLYGSESLHSVTDIDKFSFERKNWSVNFDRTKTKGQLKR